MTEAARPAGPCLAPPARYRFLEGASGDLILRPWFDRIAQSIVSNWYFPLSRAWAAALDAGGSSDRFLETLYGPGANGLGLRLLAGAMLDATEVRPVGRAFGLSRIANGPRSD